MNFLSFENWKIITYEEGSNYFYLNAAYQGKTAGCSNCRNSNKISRYGLRIRRISDIPIRGKKLTIQLSVQRYKCGTCSKLFLQDIPEIGGMSLTKRFAEYLQNQVIKMDNTFKSVSQNNFVAETTVKELFVKFVEQRESSWTFATPRILGLDGVYIERRERLIMTDLEKRLIVGIAPKATKYDAGRALLDLPNLARVDAIVIDMSMALLGAAQTVIKAVKNRPSPLTIIIDKYHVQRMINQALMKYLSITKKDRNVDAYGNFTRNRFLLLRRRYNLSTGDKENLDQWLSDEPELAIVYKIKESFLAIWKQTDKRGAIETFQCWKDSIPASLTKTIFRKILTTFRNWGEYIFNYFDMPFTNAFTESANNLIKSVQKRTRGCAYWVVRAKIIHHYFNIQYLSGETFPPHATNKYGYTVLKRSQRTLRLKYSYQHCSRVFAATFPKSEKWRDRFAPHLTKIDIEK
jgi:transposase